MFRRCLVCGGAFRPNESLEHFPLGTRVAYDPSRGRLWAVCRRCRRWSLAPMEERWEALEELEEVARGRARVLSSTENISLLRWGKLEIVRVGQANLAEQAWWRYGAELVRRRKNYKALAAAGAIGTGAAIWGGLVTGGVGLITAWILWDKVPGRVPDAARWMRFGSDAWRGRVRCSRCGYLFRRVSFRRREHLILHPFDDVSPAGLVYRCPSCRDHRQGGLHLKGHEATATSKRVLAYHNFQGASETVISGATRLIQEVGSPSGLSRILLKDGKRLGDLGRMGGIALEIASSEASEQRLLEMELAELEAHWRSEEELAAIIDGELTPTPLLDSLRRKALGEG